MSKKPTKHGDEWTPADDALLRLLAAGNTPTRVIALKLHRTPDAVRARASEKGISLKPVNRPPYGRKR